MKSALIKKVAVMFANLTDAKDSNTYVRTKGRSADKGYYTKPARQAAAKQGANLAVIMMNHGW